MKIDSNDIKDSNIDVIVTKLHEDKINVYGKESAFLSLTLCFNAPTWRHTGECKASVCDDLAANSNT